MAKKSVVSLKDSATKYMCVGEDYGPDMRIGFCGDVHSLWDWVNILYPEYDLEQIERYFGNKTDDAVLDEILVIKGKKLVKGGCLNVK